MPPPDNQSSVQLVPTIPDPDRRSIRLMGYDYSRPGAYFVTLCVHERVNLFGIVQDGAVQLNDLGQVVEDEWRRSAELRPGVTIDHFVIMPNHLHGLLILEQGRGTPRVPVDPTGTRPKASTAFGKPISGSLSTIVGQFKASASSRINMIRGSRGARVWQRNFYERIIRNERALRELRQYIAQNPSNWEMDPERRGTLRVP